jgi:hypothetical protein
VGKYVIDAQARSRAPRETVWALVADVNTWSEWGAWQATELEQEGSPVPEGVGAIRRLVRKPVTTREQVTAFEPPGRFAYEMLSGLPLGDYKAEVTLTDIADGTEIRWRSEFDARIPGTGSLLRRQLGGFIADTAKRLARAAEQRASA